MSRSASNFRIGINPDVLDNATKEYILVTLYHEALHAYFVQKEINLGVAEFKRQFLGIAVYGGRLLGVQDSEHWPMGYTDYIRGLRNSIISFNPNFSLDRAMALAKAGIIVLTPEESKINKQERNTNDPNSPGYQGTKCP